MTKKRERTRVLRSDGRMINVVRRRGHLMVCAKGCCCGRTDRGYAAVPVDFYKQEYKRRKIRNIVHLSMNGCLGPCPLANVVLLFFDGRPIWFQSIATEAQIVALFDYIERMIAADSYVPPPAELAEYVFNYYAWTGSPSRGADATPLAASVMDGILLLTHADTDLLTLRHAVATLPNGFPPVRALSLGKLASPEHMAAALAEHGSTARIVVARLLGGPSSVPGFGLLAETIRRSGGYFLAVSGTGSPDPELAAISTVSPAVLHEVTAYLQAGGGANFAHLLRFLSDHLLRTGFGYEPPCEQPRHGLYHPDLPPGASLADWLARRDPARPAVGLLFYRSHWMSGNLAFIDALVRDIERKGGDALPIFTSSLKETEATSRWPAAFAFFRHEGRTLIDVLISTISFAMGDVNPDGPTPSGWSVDALAALDVPVLQAICAGTTRWQWEASPRGLNPLDTAMNVALPEFDGRIITVPISFKEAASGVALAPREKSSGRLRNPARQTSTSMDLLHYVPVADRIARVAGLALRFAKLRRKPRSEKRIAFILTNSPGKAARIGNAVGLDAPASLLRILAALRESGYHVGELPPDGDALIHELIDRCSYDETFLTSEQLAQAAGRVSGKRYQAWFDELPPLQQRQMTEQWGPPPGEAYVHDGHIALAGLELGNVFIALQPPRGYGMDPNAIYHRPDLPPPHNYYALYRWLRDDWGADAIVHLGKHGTLEWLPGKSVGLSADCYPDSFLANIPLFYPFILNDPGEGAQAKRRGHAVIVDHLTPPLTTAESYGELAELMQLVDEYYQVEMLDPTKMPLLQRQIWDLIQRANLQDDLRHLLRQNHGDHVHEWDEALTADGTPWTLSQMAGREVAHLVQELDGYLCELAGAQIRDGLHILGQVPDGEPMLGLLAALTRLPNLDVPSLPTAIAKIFDLSIDELQNERGARLNHIPTALTQLADRPLVTNADALETIEELGHHLLAMLEKRDFNADAIDAVMASGVALAPRAEPTRGANATPLTSTSLGASEVRAVLSFVCTHVVPALRRTSDEIDNLLAALDGRYVPAGPSGAPTRGMAHVLPTGRNFYAVDPRALPSSAAWQVGQELAREVLERYRAETGAYPEGVGISVWGTSAMRTHGDDVAEVLALLGVRPRWHKENHRIAGVEPIPLAELGRPRIDVTVRISGFFRDAFPHLIQLLDEAVRIVTALDEPPEQNFVRKHYLTDLAAGLAAGLPDAERRARYRVFGSKPGSYGAGILPLIDERNWHDDADFAETYVNWGGYAYTADEMGVDARAVFRDRLAGVQVALHNQDNREHDIFDSDDYFQFHGGMIATIRALTGRKPQHYFGDTHNPARPAVRDLEQEALRVFRTRVVNPKWLESITRHGYKGGLELAATVDYLFGYDATAGVVEDWMYEQVAQSYALDAPMREFFARSNPWALHAIAERLLEAAQRGMWESPGPETVEALRATLLDSEAMLEARSEATLRS
ncbi:MAG TPA: cobaltochelatase subunit CobN [Gemmataceae bacterium]|nr:cobaltochelatase subunit CobN [Gemmataceae bacterium]